LRRGTQKSAFRSQIIYSVAKLYKLMSLLPANYVSHRSKCLKGLRKGASFGCRLEPLNSPLQDDPGSTPFIMLEVTTIAECAQFTRSLYIPTIRTRVHIT